MLLLLLHVLVPLSETDATDAAGEAGVVEDGGCGADYKVLGVQTHLAFTTFDAKVSKTKEEEEEADDEKLLTDV